jgi:CO/xanthine dehydrogenase Mo-binding subunit
MDDITSREAVKQFKWVGTRPVRPDGVPKVTGLAQYGADLAMPGMLVGRILRSPHAMRALLRSTPRRQPGCQALRPW